MPLPLTVSCFSKIQIGFTFLVPAHPGSPGKRAVKRVCVCVCVQYGICFDIDGVVARGLSPIPEAIEAFKMLCDEKTGRPKVPFVFLTNGFNSAHVKAQRLQNWLPCEVIYMPLASNVSRCYWFVCHQKYYLC